MGIHCDIVKGIYAAFGKGDVPGVLGALDAGIRWNKAESFQQYTDKQQWATADGS
jgi:TPP-dependent trihydroxycyclohexane-1,2-dione (THcHDO) dehydratase